ncbi:neutral/alkaline non-lysosomal ceramidase N-terminal domain-containing protein [Helcobacillus massiliensis]|uniref:Neutral ceramidase n=1 Tax=Helcobacillus massiliensis TaxID=521392 RepID=A0A839QUR8_9MICO|nr:neutral/alkaline non-lysosomal ceramidase N-terminal domain-containing protein [Helcobacillus massiliensis]MBB3024034.1 neutral ceramidase [Helcobacillus massiliensis]
MSPSLSSPRRSVALLSSLASVGLGLSLIAAPASAAPVDPLERDTTLADTATLKTPAAPVPATDTSAMQILTGSGTADITGEPGENGMMGYGDGSQKSSGIHMRQYARAFAFQDPATGERTLIITADVLSGTNLVRQQVLAQLKKELGDKYTDANVMIVGTHTHATPGGDTDYSLYNVTTMGVHQKTLDARVNGMVDAAKQADASLAPSTLSLGTAELTDAGMNRSMAAWERNPSELKAKTPGARDPKSVTLGIDRQGDEPDIINFFGTHPTSLTSKNTLISGDNKGYAQSLYEAETGGTGAFLMSGGADQTPNLNLKPGSGPTDDEFENMRIMGSRQHDAAVKARQAAEPMGSTTVKSQILWLDMQNQTVSAEYSTTGKTERTCRAILGAPFGAGSQEDGGGGATFLHEGDGNNPFFEAITKGTQSGDAALRHCQAPKATLFESGLINGVQTVLPLQLIQVGDLWIVGAPGEVTAASSVMLREAVAQKAGIDPDQVVVAQAANAYGHYFATPWEFEQQDYEGGATLFGRFTVPALQQGYAKLADHLANGAEIDPGEAPKIRPYVKSAVGVVLYDLPGTRRYGDVLTQPAGEVKRGQRASAVFQGAHPNNDLRHNDTYLAVERKVVKADGSASWERIADDNDFTTRFEWKRHLAAQSHVTVSWDVPEDAAAGEYRLRYFGTAKNGAGQLKEISGISHSFRVG